jgi:signal transduction histidine kinase/ActR/RegA family two-component response regulator
MDPVEGMRTERRLVAGALTFLGYLAAADAGHALGLSIAPTLIWPAAGIALAAAFVSGAEAVAAVFLAQFVFVFFVAGYALPVALALAAASALQAAEAAWLLRRFSFNSGFSRLFDACLFIGVALVCAAITPTLGVAAFAAAHLLPLGALRASWGEWYVGELFSLLVVAPLLLRWLPKPVFSRSRREWVESGIALALVAALTFVIAATPYGSLGGVPLIYVLLLPLFWIALRLGSRMTTLALALLALIAVVGAISRSGASGLAEAVFGTELLVAVLAVIYLIAASLAEERNDATATLHIQLLRLERALEKIRDEEEAKNGFIALLAHELRNPLAPLLSSLELIRLSGSDQATRHSVNAMRGRVRTMARLLDDLLDLSRIERRALSLTTERADLATIARRAIETAEPLWKAKRQRFAAELPARPLEVTADPTRIEQVIVNLLTNAHKYTPAGGAITLSLALEGEEAVLRVADTGAGIAPEMREQIFAPFSQGEPGRRVGGLGIGLALSKELVDMHGGRITAESAGIERGSEFVVCLPCAQGAAPAARPERARELKRLPALTSPLSVLIVDDNRAAADALAALLAHVGHAPETAYDGASGIKKAKRLAPAAVILDIGLPDLSGYEVAARLAREAPGSALVALTGFGQEEDRRKSLAAGFSYHLVKPVGLADLEPVLREIAKTRPAGARRKRTRKR